ncbi:MAG: MarR family winged helix-turn-helix transcriptional regulator [Pseudomonadota bacterium]|nr:MarR family winged helix-turn-helix transcriptional regulator [Pseudomonadota bacterium]
MNNLAFNPLSCDGGHQLAIRAEDIRQRLSSALELVNDIAATPQPRTASQPVTEEHVQAILKLRRSRDRFFEAELFADPAWDILLELYAAELGQRRTSVSSLCVGAAVPATTALRWIKTLEDKGLIQRAADPMDRRRVFVWLADDASQGIGNFFRSIPPGATLV